MILSYAIFFIPPSGNFILENVHTIVGIELIHKFKMHGHIPLSKSSNPITVINTLNY